LVGKSKRSDKSLIRLGGAFVLTTASWFKGRHFSRAARVFGHTENSTSCQISYSKMEPFLS